MKMRNMLMVVLGLSLLVVFGCHEELVGREEGRAGETGDCGAVQGGAGEGGIAAVEDFIVRFVEAAEKNDEAAVGQMLPKDTSKGRAGGVIKDMQECIAVGARPTAVDSVRIHGDYALVATEIFEFADSHGQRKQCLVYRVRRQGADWVILDIDLESAEGLKKEVRRFDERHKGEGKG
jgi:hypothetical protein